jgi:hypothetical protein
MVAGHRTVSTDGTVGNLHLETATEQNITAAAGPPDATADDHYSPGTFPPYRALGYDCTVITATGGFDPHYILVGQLNCVVARMVC